jgi:polysaccharide biosynthesis/export protein
MTVRPLAFLTACLMAASILPTAAGQDPQKTTPVQEPVRHEGGTATIPAPAATTPPPAAAPAPAASTPAVTPAPPAVIEPSADAFRIGPEDVLDVQVWKNAELSRVVPVRPDGMISLPLVNDIRAAGLTPTELRAQVTQRLSEFIPSPEVSVIVREVHSVKVAVLGAVKMPGHYEVNSTATVLDLIARAQGLTDFADRGRIVVLRQNGKTTKRIPFNYRKVADGSEQENFVVQPGDIIVVP